MRNPTPIRRSVPVHFLLLLSAELPCQMTWQLTATNQPSARVAPAAFDDEHGQGVLFGGHYYTTGNPWNITAYNDTWIWQGGVWTQASPAHTPPGRFRNAMSYDPVRKRVVLGGGPAWFIQSGAYTYRDDTWEWDGNDWHQIPVTNSPFTTLRSLYAMAYDPVNQGTLLFGGGDSTAAYLGDTWLFDGVDWQQLSPPSAPSPRQKFGMVYDSTRQRIDLLGGYGPGGYYGWQSDHWTWDGTTWTHQGNPFLSHNGISSTSLFHDPSRGRTVTYGFMSNVSQWSTQTWEYDGVSWTQALPVASPSNLSIVANFYDSWMGVGVSYLGALAQTWTYTSPTPAGAIPYAPGCLGSAGVPSLRLVQRPILGATYEVACDNLSAGSLSFLMLGWGMQNLPLTAITPLSAPGCALRTTTDYQFSLVGTNTYTLAIPNDPSFLGAALNNQVVSGEFANNSLSLVTVSNALRMVMGNP